MKKGILAYPSVDIIQLVANILLEEKEYLSRNLVVFPGKRPSHFLRRYLADVLKSPFRAPKLLSIEEFVDFCCKLSGRRDRRINDIDAVSIIFNLHKKNRLIGREGEELDIDSFLIWGFKIFSDFEEMYMAGVKPSDLQKSEVIAGEKLPGSIYERLTSLSVLYESFYEYLLENELSTRASRYRDTLNTVGEIDLNVFKKVIFVGFFAFTNTERKIFEQLKTRDNVSFIFQKGHGIELTISELNIDVEEMGEDDKSPKISFYRAMDVHGEVFSLNQVLHEKKDFDRKDVIALPSTESLFPIVQQTLPFTNNNYNISMGYPLFRTPVYSLIETLGRLLETREDDEYFVPDYLRFVLHPYVKNIYYKGASYPTRIILHTIEEQLVKRNRRFVKLEEIEEDKSIIQECVKKLKEGRKSNISTEKVIRHLKKIHTVLIKPFEDIKNVEDFGEKLLVLVTFISTSSPAKMHPYTRPFIKRMIEGIYELKTSGLKDEKFNETKSYLKLLRNYFRTVTYPFEGTPVKGLQVLGFLETRNIKFNTLYLLDGNEGIIPDTKKEDTLLPYEVRKHLGLPTYVEKERIARYHFERLVNCAKEVHIFYVESADKEKSRFVEKLMWNLQKEHKNLELQNQKEAFFGVQFSQKNPGAIRKNEDMIKCLEKHRFSPSALDTYLHCPLRFYYQYVLNLQEKEAISDVLEAIKVGDIVHKILEKFFKPKVGREMKIEDEDYQRMDEIVEDLFAKHYGGNVEGGSYLTKLQVKRRMRDVINLHNNKFYDVVIEECEDWHEGKITLSNGQKVNLVGKIDRIDRRNGQICVVDYKTGKNTDVPSTTKFPASPREEWYKTLKSVQLPFYILVYLDEHKDISINEINSCLMLLGTKTIKEEFLFKDKTERKKFFVMYREAITTLIGEILDKNVEFSPTKDFEKECVWCSYKNICGTQWVVKKW